MSDPISKAVSLLNDVLECDREVITRLINLRIDCNERMASHATIKVQRFGDVTRIGVLGLLNGVLGCSPKGDVGA